MPEQSFRNIISVVICTYNQQETIGRAIDSVLRQKCLWPIEIIVGDDCSLDDTSAICRQYVLRYPEIIRYFRNEENKGIVDNYFSCLLRCQGKYIADIAGDDEWCDDEKLEKERKYLEEHSDTVMVHTDYLLRNDVDSSLSKPSPYVFQRQPREGLSIALDVVRQRARPLAHLCTSLYRNDAFRKCHSAFPKYFTGREYPCEDVQLTMLMAYMGKIAYLDCITLKYNVSPHSISNSDDERKAFVFKRDVFRLMIDLRDTLSICHKDFSECSQFRIYELFMHVARLDDCSLRDDILRIFKDNEIEVVSVRNRAMLFILSHSVLWYVWLILRKIKKAL